jgi:hypothetical protein
LLLTLNVFPSIYMLINDSELVSIFQWLPQIKHHSPNARIILVGRRKENNPNESTYPISARQLDGTRIAQLIGAVAYLEINSEAPQEDLGLEQLTDVLAWTASGHAHSNI